MAQIVNVHIELPEDHTHAYYPADVVAERPDFMHQAIEELRRYIIGFQRRYGQIEALAPLIADVERAMEAHMPQIETAPR